MPRFVYFIFTKGKEGKLWAITGSHTVSTGNTSILWGTRYCLRGRKSLGNKKATALLLIFNGPLGEGKRGVFSCGNRLALGKLIKEAYCRWPVFHLLVAGPHSSWLLPTTVHQRAARKGEPLQDSLTTHHVLWSPARVQCAEWNKGCLGRFMRIACVQKCVSSPRCHSKHIIFKHGFPCWICRKAKTYFSYYGADVPVGNGLKSVFHLYILKFSKTERIRFRKAVC